MSARTASILPAHLLNICSGDCCQMAVTRVFGEMRQLGRPDQFAYDAALTVFRWHHPEISRISAKDIVEHWVHPGAMH